MTAPPSSPPKSPTAATRPWSAHITEAWQRKGPLAIALLPLSWCNAALGAMRRSLYRVGLCKAYRAPVPVVVVGNVIAGGAGKTPVTLHLVQALQAQGWRPAIISRGYGRENSEEPEAIAVTVSSNPSLVGDEPLLMAQRSGVPVYVAARRATAAQAALQAHPEVDVLVCDDGLQHLALARDVEIAVFNAQGIGNGWQLPAGPLREPWPKRLDMVLYAGQPPQDLAHSGAAAWPLQRSLAPYAVGQDGRRHPLADLRDRPVHALAAIAYPQEFFAMLQAQGLQLLRSDALPDHAPLDDPQWLASLGIAAASGPTIAAADTPVLLCTEKDAHKLWRIAPQALAVPLEVAIDPAFGAQANALLRQRQATLSLIKKD
ncbi:tetraacyldisaccharide 4'-kinase [Comamonas sp. BIGb0152]|uniref:tetraacyldisaccharide 4'-kinase n=1 Tax=Comamonas sp. BIGb0152 TaxID=2940601 RepID=UPI002168E757|nr:tetraacyldisaccharide 4'-kinase [Comamonas sp. BIGb0152]MCS4292660.1 tetraacyldisaccharide 4'-kinase [Comamonas sp. BIGb0152]